MRRQPMRQPLLGKPAGEFLSRGTKIKAHFFKHDEEGGTIQWAGQVTIRGVPPRNLWSGGSMAILVQCPKCQTLPEATGIPELRETGNWFYLTRRYVFEEQRRPAPSRGPKSMDQMLTDAASGKSLKPEPTRTPEGWYNAYNGASLAEMLSTASPIDLAKSLKGSARWLALSLMATLVLMVIFGGAS